MADSNSIGEFQIGVSPVGTTPLLDFFQTVISQYANSPILLQLITDFFSYVDQTANFDSFFDLIWNVDTAQGAGLDVWGRIVDVSRVLEVTVGDNFGFTDGSQSSGDPFDQSPFFGGSPLTQNYSLSDDAYRLLILAKALANISDGSIPGINQILLKLFPGRGNCYVIDNLDMSMVYHFDFMLSPVEIAVIAQSGVLPKPTGVSSSYIAI